MVTSGPWGPDWEGGKAGRWGDGKAARWGGGKATRWGGGEVTIQRSVTYKNPLLDRNPLLEDHGDASKASGAQAIRY